MSCDELKEVTLNQCYLFKNVISKGMNSHEYDLEPVFVFDEKSSVVEISDDRLGASMYDDVSGLADKIPYEMGNIKGTLLNIELNPIDTARYVVALAWLQDHECTTCIEIKDTDHPILNWKSGTLLDIRSASVKDRYLSRTGYVHIILNDLTATSITCIGKSTTHLNSSKDVLVRNVEPITSFDEIPQPESWDNIPMYYSFTGVIKHVIKVKADEDNPSAFTYLACPYCTRKVPIDHAGLCKSCPETFDQENQPYNALFLRAGIANNIMKKEEPLQVTIFPSAKFFDSLPDGTFSSKVAEKTFCNKSEAAQKTYINAIVKKKIVFNVVVQVVFHKEYKNPVVVKVSPV